MPPIGCKLNGTRASWTQVNSSQQAGKFIPLTSAVRGLCILLAKVKMMKALGGEHNAVNTLEEKATPPKTLESLHRVRRSAA